MRAAGSARWTRVRDVPVLAALLQAGPLPDDEDDPGTLPDDE